MLKRRIPISWQRPTLLLLGLCALTAVWAHGPAESGADGAHGVGWTFPPLVTINLLLAATIYGSGVHRLWQRAGRGKGIRFKQVGAFATGMLVLVIALLSPIDALSDDLGWMHMVQHMLIINVGAPLLVLGAPGTAFLWLLPPAARRWTGSFTERTRPGKTMVYMLWQPVLLWSLFALTLWVWHLPALYEHALRNELFHDFQHFTFLITACLFWRVLLDPVSRLRLSRMGAILYLFLTSLHATLLGVFMALAPSVWYPTYEGRTLSWSVTALEDQQLAGLIMWMPACMAFAVVAAISLAFWLEGTSKTPAHLSHPRT